MLEKIGIAVKKELEKKKRIDERSFGT